MSGRDEEFDAQLAERGDDRPGLDDLEADDFSGLRLDAADDDFDDEDDPDAEEEDDEDDPEDDDEEDDDEDGEAEEPDDDESDDDYPEDALDDEIDLVVALYREDGKSSGLALPKELANDFDELIEQLRRVPGDAGALGVVVIDSDFFVLVRVRGRKVEVLLSDSLAANDWPVARDAADYLGVEIPEDEEDSAAVGDFDMFADTGLSEFELEQICSDLDADPVDLVGEIATKLGLGPAFTRAAASFDL